MNSVQEVKKTEQQRKRWDVDEIVDSDEQNLLNSCGHEEKPTGMRRRLRVVTKEKHFTQISQKTRPREKAEADKDSDASTETFRCVYEARKK